MNSFYPPDNLGMNLGCKHEERMAEHNQSSEYIGKTGVGQRLHRSTRTIEKWMKRGYLPYLRVGRSVLFHWPTVERHLNENYQQCHHPQARPVTLETESPAPAMTRQPNRASRTSKGRRNRSRIENHRYGVRHQHAGTPVPVLHGHDGGRAGVVRHQADHIHLASARRERLAWCPLRPAQFCLQRRIACQHNQRTPGDPAIIPHGPGLGLRRAPTCSTGPAAAPRSRPSWRRALAGLRRSLRSRGNLRGGLGGRGNLRREPGEPGRPCRGLRSRGDLGGAWARRVGRPCDGQVPIALKATRRTALVIAMSSVWVRLSVDVSIESVSRQSPDGSARSMREQRPIANTTAPVGSSTRANTGSSLRKDLVPNPQRGLMSRWPRDGGGRPEPVILADSTLHPRGGHAWLSAARTHVVHMSLEKIEKMRSSGRF